MEHAGYKAKIMAAPRLVGDRSFDLPPGIPMAVIPIACLPGCPDDWVRGAGTYVIPVKEDVGIWFDWTDNPQESIAIVPSVKRMNPISGLPLDSMAMEQFRDKCPKHGIAFAHGRVCEECGYAWPPQNYVSNPNVLWWDGFRLENGKVAQFFYTPDGARDVASAVIGKPNTVPAFGFGIFRYKHYREMINQPVRPTFGEIYKGGGPSGASSSSGSAFSLKISPAQFYNVCGNTNGPDGDGFAEEMSAILTSTRGGFTGSPVSMSINSLSESTPRGVMMKARTDSFSKQIEEIKTPQPVKEVSIGGGATIKQDLKIDCRPLDDYHSEPQAVFRVYFVFEQELETIVCNGGVKKIEASPEGFLKNVPTG